MIKSMWTVSNVMACIVNMSPTVLSTTKLLRCHALQELNSIWLLAFVIIPIMSNALLV